jgi:hypothetical protein
MTENRHGLVVATKVMQATAAAAHVAQNTKGRASAIDARTTRHPG